VITYCLLDVNNNVVNIQMSARPSGPVMGNFQYSRGYRWVRYSEVPMDKIDEFVEES
jgi:hypothetical protein